MLIKDIDKLSQDSSDLGEEFIDDYDDDLDDEDEKGKKTTKVKNKKKDKEKKGMRFIPLPESEAKKHKRRQVKTRQKEIEDRQKQMEIANLQAEGISTKQLENEAFVKFIRELFKNPDDTNFITKENKNGNENFLRRLRESDRFKDILSQLPHLTPRIFTGEFNKVIICSLCKFKDYQASLN